MEICGVEIDFSKQNGYFINSDCMEGMKQFPDKFFDLAIIDPPYGDAKLSDKSGGVWNRFGQRFDRYKYPSPEKECQAAGRNMGLCKLEEPERGSKQKKILRGTSRRNRNILKNCFASHGIRSSGAATILNCRRQDAS